MQIKCSWKNGMVFAADNGTNTVAMDGKKPFGSDTALTPKELVVAGLCGCTAMDVIGLMRKHKQTVSSFEIDAMVEATQAGHPVVFTSVQLVFKLSGEIDANVLLESVKLSQTKYCGVSAMLAKAVPIHYSVELNGVEVGKGQADFV